MDFSFKIEGLDRIANASKAVQTSIYQEMKKGLYASAMKVESEAKKSILEGGKTGRIYKRGNVIHQASAAGEAPASDTGRLAGSIKAYPATNELESSIVAGRGLVKYARLLEFGTTKIKPRPFMFPALEKSRKWIQDRLNDAVIKGVLKVTKK